MAFKLPFPKWALVTPVKIYSTYINEDGEPIETLLYNGLCNYNEVTKRVRNEHGELVTIVGKVICEGDIAPNYNTIEGYVEINKVKSIIYKSSRPRNPDNSVFSTELELS